MKILRGKYKGEEVEISQFCNDWFTDVNGRVYGPCSLQLHPHEVKRVLEEKEKGGTGVMFYLYVLDVEAGRFKRRKRE